jgi:hypothetical protein
VGRERDARLQLMRWTFPMPHTPEITTCTCMHHHYGTVKTRTAMHSLHVASKGMHNALLERHVGHDPTRATDPGPRPKTMGRGGGGVPFVRRSLHEVQ